MIQTWLESNIKLGETSTNFDVRPLSNRVMYVDYNNFYTLLKRLSVRVNLTQYTDLNVFYKCTAGKLLMH